MKPQLMTVEEASKAIVAGKPILVAGDEKLLKRLPRGQWIGGTIPYFMAEEGGTRTSERLMVNNLTGIGATSIRLYSADELPQMLQDGPEHGLAFVIIPANSPAHLRFALGAPSFPNFLIKPAVGWIAGVGVDEIGKVKPKVFNGESSTVSEDCAVVMHIALPAQKSARVDIVNVFEQGAGDSIRFEKAGFSATEALINGEKRPFAPYLLSKKADTRLPLVADYYGARINTSFQAVDEKSGLVSFYAPVFEGVEYRLAKPMGDYPAAFQAAMPKDVASPLFTCNCILNYLYSSLEGKKTGSMIGPITFGEIAYQLLNQTLAYLVIEG